MFRDVSPFEDFLASRHGGIPGVTLFGSGHELRVVFAPPKIALGDGAGFPLDPA